MPFTEGISSDLWNTTHHTFWPLALQTVETLGDSLESFGLKPCVVQECLPATLPACPSPAWTSAGPTEPFPALQGPVAATRPSEAALIVFFLFLLLSPSLTALDSPAQLPSSPSAPQDRAEEGFPAFLGPSCLFSQISWLSSTPEPLSGRPETSSPRRG